MSLTDLRERVWRIGPSIVATGRILIVASVSRQAMHFQGITQKPRPLEDRSIFAGGYVVLLVAFERTAVDAQYYNHAYGSRYGILFE